LAEELKVLAAQAPDLHTALRRVADEAWSQVILDGKLFVTERLAEAVSVNPTAPGKSELPCDHQVRGIIICAGSQQVHQQRRMTWLRQFAPKKLTASNL
jgi:hypothetical protein